MSEVEGALAGQPGVQAAYAPHEGGAAGIVGAQNVKLHVCRQFRPQVHAAGGHLQVVPAQRQFAHESVGHEAVSVGQVIGEHRRARHDEDAKWHRCMIADAVPPA